MRSTRFAVLGVVTVAVLALTACGPGGGDEPDGDRSLRLSMPSAPPSLQIGALDEGDSSVIWTGIYDSLLTRDSSAEPQPAIAESWEVSPDGTELTFDIRDGQTFSDGTPLDAEAVVASLELSRTSPSTSAAFSLVTNITAPDAATVLIELSAPDTGLIYDLGQSAGAVGAPDSIASQSGALSPIGSGPYVLDESATTNGSIYTLRKRDDHWNAGSYAYDTVEVRVIEDPAAALNAVRAGEIDFLALSNPADGDPLEAAGLTVAQTPAVAWSGFYLADRAGTVLEPLGDVRVRRAINLAIDRAAIVQQLNAGLGSVTGQIFDANGPVYLPELDDTYPYDPDAARELMAEAGYADGFTLQLPSSVLSQVYEPTIGQQLGEIGITVEWQPVPFDQLLGAVFSAQYPVFWFFTGYNVAQHDVEAALAPTGGFNPFHAEDPELSELLETAEAATTSEAAAETYREINRWAVDNAWFAPVFTYQVTFATSASVVYTPREAAGLRTLDLYSPAS